MKTPTSSLARNLHPLRDSFKPRTSDRSQISENLRIREVCVRKRQSKWFVCSDDKVRHAGPERNGSSRPRILPSAVEQHGDLCGHAIFDNCLRAESPRAKVRDGGRRLHGKRGGREHRRHSNMSAGLERALQVWTSGPIWRGAARSRKLAVSSERRRHQGRIDRMRAHRLVRKCGSQRSRGRPCQ